MSATAPEQARADGLARPGELARPTAGAAPVEKSGGEGPGEGGTNRGTPADKAIVTRSPGDRRDRARPDSRADSLQDGERGP